MCDQSKNSDNSTTEVSQCFDFVRSTMSSLLRSTQRLILMNQNQNVAQMRPMSGGHDPGMIQLC